MIMSILKHGIIRKNQFLHYIRREKKSKKKIRHLTMDQMSSAVYSFSALSHTQYGYIPIRYQYIHDLRQYKEKGVSIIDTQEPTIIYYE